MEIRERLATILKRKRWGGADLARELGEHRNWVNGRLAGTVAIKTEDIVRIAEALGMPLAELFESEQRPPEPAVLSPAGEVIVTLIRSLPVEKQQEAVRYLHFLADEQRSIEEEQRRQEIKPVAEDREVYE